AAGLSAQTPHASPPNSRDGFWTCSLPPYDPTSTDMSRRVPVLGACKHVRHGSFRHTRVGTMTRPSSWGVGGARAATPNGPPPQQEAPPGGRAERRKQNRRADESVQAPSTRAVVGPRT